MDPITADRLDELTREPLLAVLSTVNPDGIPQSTPLWYHYDGEYLICACYSHRIKARNIRQNPEVALVVVDTVAAAEGLIVRGTAEVIEDGAEEATIRNAVRYLGEKDGKGEGGHRSTPVGHESRFASRRSGCFTVSEGCPTSTNVLQ